MAVDLARHNYRRILPFTVAQFTPLYWPYMYHYVTVTLSLSASDFGTLKAIYYLTVVLCEVPFGILADRIRRRTVLAFGTVANAAGCAIYVGGSSFAELALGEVAFGFGTALVSGASSALLYDSFRAAGRTREYARAEGRCRSAALLASTLGLPAAGAWLVHGDDVGLTYAATFFLAAAGVIPALGLREPPREPSRERAAGGAAWNDVRTSSGIQAILLYAAGVFVLVRASIGLLFNPVMHAATVPIQTWGTAMAAIGLIGAVASWGVHVPLERLGTRRVAAGIAVTSAAMYVGLATSEGPWAALWFGLIGIATGALPVVTLQALNARVPDSSRRATILSLDSLLSRLTYGATALAIGALLDFVPLSTALYATLGIACVPLILALATWRRAQTDGDATPRRKSEPIA